MAERTLTTPIGRQATKYRLARLAVDFEARTIEFQVRTLDDQGQQVELLTTTRGLTEMASQAAPETVVQARTLQDLEDVAVAWFKALGRLN